MHTFQNKLHGRMLRDHSSNGEDQQTTATICISHHDHEKLMMILDYVMEMSKFVLYTKNERAKVQHDSLDEQILAVIESCASQLGPLSPSTLATLFPLLKLKFTLLQFDDETVLLAYLPRLLQYLFNYLKVPEVLLSIGGDDRLTINPENKQNKYFASTLPRSQIIRRGSCTCSTLTEESYELVWRIHAHFLRGAFHVLLSQTTPSAQDSTNLSQFYASFNQQLIRRLEVFLGLDRWPTIPKPANAPYAVSTPQIVLFPSGSDAEFLPLITGLVRSFQLSKTQFEHTVPMGTKGSIPLESIYSGVKVLNYVVAAGEVGSGTPQAATGQHFSPLSPRGTQQRPGQSLAGIRSEMIEMIPYIPRDIETGQVRFQEAALIEDISHRLITSPTAVAVLHLVCGSKTGLIYPSSESLHYLQEQFGPTRLLIVVDACQFRNQVSLIAEYLQKQYLVLVTGSKFFTGPPFCGAVLLPTSIATDLETYLADHLQSATATSTAAAQSPPLREESLLPIGLIDYLSQYEVGEGLPYLRDYLTYYNQGLTPPLPLLHHTEATNTPLTTTPTSEVVASIGGWFNYALSLRWALSLDTMERYQSLPLSIVKEFTKLWIERIRVGLEVHAPLIQLLEDEVTGIRQENLDSLNSIVSFRLFVRVTGPTEMPRGPEGVELRELSFEEYKIFHQRLTQFSSTEGGSGERESSAVMLGQPVKLSSSSTTGKTVLRLALGADMVVKALEPAHHLLTVQRSTACFTDRTMITLLREAFHSLSYQISLNEKKGDPFTRFEENPFYLPLQHCLQEDSKVLTRIFEEILYWETVHSSSKTTASTTASHAAHHHHAPLPVALKRRPSLQGKGLPSHHYFTEKRQKFHWLDQIFQWKIFPPISSSDAVAPAVLDMLALPTALLQLSTQSRHSSIHSNNSSSSNNAMILYDLDALHRSVQSLHQAFTSRPTTNTVGHTRFLHCFAIKSCPISYLLHRLQEMGCGFECASLTEVKQALACGALPHQIVYDSPCKTYAELSFALETGIRVNANSYRDLEKIDLILTEQQQSSSPLASIGVRINPLVGLGAIEALSTATAESKFGLPLFSRSSSFPVLTLPETLRSISSLEEEEIALRPIFAAFETFEQEDPVFHRVIQTCLQYTSTWLTGIMCHVGSQGMSLDLMVQGIERIYLLMRYLEAKSSPHGLKRKRFTWLDIGGGLSCNYTSQEIAPSFEDYARIIRERLPGLFMATTTASSSSSDGAAAALNSSFVVLTEFGKSLIAKTAVMVSKIEDILENPLSSTTTNSTNSSNSSNSSILNCIVHVGADVLLRTAYCPEQFSHHRVQLIDANYHYVIPSSSDATKTNPVGYDPIVQTFPESTILLERPLAVQRVNLVGPLCFSGDILAKRLSLPEPRIGDWIILSDVGANAISMYSRHCSRLSPMVVGFRRVSCHQREKKGREEVVITQILRAEETVEEVLRFWD